MKKYNILILSNKDNEGITEDIYIADAFRKDGHYVELLWVDYDECLDSKFDVIIRRNTWVEDDKEIYNYAIKSKLLKCRLIAKNIKTVNLNGLDGEGKEYLYKLYKEGKKVIPTSNNIENAKEFNSYTEYVLKKINSFGRGFGQKIIKKDDLDKEFKEGYLIQPKMKFKSEVQCYFVADKLMYVYEYTPSKYPNYPEPHLITLSKEQEKLAYEFSKESNLKVGFQRIDFLRLDNDEFLLLEIEDTSPYMSLDKLDKEFRNKVLEEYKKNIYEYLDK